MLVKTLCPYCGVGCSFYLKVERGAVKEVVGDKKDPLSEGAPCIKGISSIDFIYSKDRIKTPLIRKNGNLVKASWKEAYQEIYKNLKKIKKKDIIFYASSPASNEDNYLLQKFARKVFKTDNIDSSARVCHATSTYAFNRAFGISAMPSRIEELSKADCVLVIGSNPKATYPVAFNKVLKSKAKIICVRSYKDETSFHSNLFLEIKNGTDIALLNCILNILSKKYGVKIPQEIEKVVRKYDVGKVSIICGLSKEGILKAVNWIAKSERFALMYGMDLTQHSYGVDNVFSAINLVLAKKGKIFSMRGKANIQGVGDMGCEPLKGGKTITEAIFLEPVKAFYLTGSDIALSLPDLNTVHEVLKKSFVVMHATFPNKTMEFANVVLPICSWSERSGTFTNAESRIRHFNKAIKPLYDSKPYWLILKELVSLFKVKFDYNSDLDILKEIKENVQGYEKIDVQKLVDGDYTFVDRKIKFEKYNPVEFERTEEYTFKEYPLLLTTTRSPYQFCSSELSSRTRLNNFVPEPFCLINPFDAKRYNIKEGESVRILSCAGVIKMKMKITDRTREGLLVAPFNYGSSLVNKLMPLCYSPLIEEPNLKRVAVKLEKIWPLDYGP